MLLDGFGPWRLADGPCCLLRFKEQCEGQRFFFGELKVRHAGAADVASHLFGSLQKLEEISSSIPQTGLAQLRRLLTDGTLSGEIGMALDAAEFKDQRFPSRR